MGLHILPFVDENNHKSSVCTDRNTIVTYYSVARHNPMKNCLRSLFNVLLTDGGI